MRGRQRMATVFMKIKLFCLCLMAALFIPMAGCCKKNESGISEDSLRKLALQYYSDIRHWNIFVEEPTIVKIDEDSDFDKAGLKHATFQWSLNCLAIPTKSDLKYMPRAIAFTKYFEEMIPVAGLNAEQLQMIRSAVFPFSTNYPAEISSSQLFQEYVDQIFFKQSTVVFSIR